MNSRRWSIAHILIASCTAILFFATIPSGTHSPENTPLMKQMSVGEEGDDPWAREEWETRRLVDPRTGRIPANIREKELAFASTLPTKEEFVGRLEKGERASVFTWTRRGPTNVGGRTRALAIDVRTTTPPNVTIIAGGISGGLWKSTNDGTSWVKATTPTQLHSATCLAQDTRSGQLDVWYAGTGEARGNSAGATGGGFLGNGIYKSTDNGTSWNLLANTSSNTPQTYDNAFDYVHNVAVDPTTGNVYAAASNTVLKSTNGGSNWTTVLGALANNATSDVQVASSGVAFAAINSSSAVNPGIWRSPDGVTWTQINVGVAGFASSFSRVDIAIAPSNPNVVYFLVQQSDTSTSATQVGGHQLWKYTFISGNGSGAGGSWVNRGGNLPFESGLSGNARFDSQFGYDIHMAVKPDDENCLIIGGTTLYRSTDAFASTTKNWTRIGGYKSPTSYELYTNHHPDQHAGMFMPGSNTVFYSGDDGGVQKTLDVTASSVSWNSLNNGYFTTQFYTVAIEHATPGDNTVVGGLQDNGTWWTNTTTVSTPWVSVFGGDGAYCAIADGKSSYYFSAQNGVMYRYILDAAGGFVNYANIQPTSGSGYMFINPFVLDPNDSKKMYLLAGTSIWRNTDLTAIPLGVDQKTSVNWTQLTGAITGNNVVSLAVSTNPADRLYFATYNSSLLPAGQLYRVDNAATGNPSPTDITGSNFPSGYISCIAVNPSDADQVLVVFSNYSILSLFYTLNGGTSWTEVGGNLEQNTNGTGNGPSCRWGAIMPTSQGTNYFVATSTGVYSTAGLNGSGTLWTLEASNLIGNAVVDMLDYRTSDGVLVAATHGNGVFSTNVITSVPSATASAPLQFALEQNYPNPFNPSTTITFSIPRESYVRLAVHDAAGREIRTLVNEVQSAGNHRVRWDGRDDRGKAVASGVYFSRMESGSFVATQKMTLLK